MRKNQSDGSVALENAAELSNSVTLDGLKKLLDASLDVICSVDADGRFITVSAASKSLWGYEPNELIGRSYIDLVLEEDVPATNRIAAEIMAGMPTTSFENRFVCRDGTVKPILWSSRWVEKDKAMYAIAKDATQLATARKLQEKQENRLRRAYQLAQIAWWELDLASQTYTCSDEIFQIYGLPIPEGNRCSMEEFFSTVHPDDVSMLQWDLTELSCAPYFSYEHRIIKSNGEIAYLIHYSELIRDDHGAPVALHGSTKDITETKRYELQLEASEQRLQQYAQKLSLIMESLGDGFFALDRSWLVTYWNKKAEQVSQIRQEDIIGKNIWEVYPKAKTLQYYSCYHKAISENTPVCFEEYSPSYNIWMEVSAYPTTEGLAVYIKDITERKKHQEERRIWEEKFQQANKSLQGVLESMSDGYYSVDREWTITYATDRMAAMLGLSKEEYLGKNLWACFPEATNSKFYREFHRAFAENRFVSFEEYYPPFDMWSEVNVYPKGDELAVYQRNITERKRQERELQTSKERFQTVCMATSDVIWDWNLETGELYIHQSFTQVFGYKLPAAESLTPLWLNNLHPEDKERVIASQKEALTNRDVSLWKERYRFLKANGDTAHVSDRAVIVRNEEGIAIRMIGAVKDITKEKKQEQRLQFMAKATSEVIWERAVDSEEVEVTTEKFNQLFGYELSGGRSTHSFWRERVHPEDLPRITLNREQALTQGQEFYLDEYRFKRADGTWAIVKERTYLIKNDENKVVSLLGAIEDVTNQRMAEKALVESESNYRLLFNHAPLPTLISDAETLQYLDVNSAALAHFGYTREEFLALTVLDIRPKEEQSRLLQHMHNVRHHNRNKLEHFIYHNKSGEVLLAEVSASLIDYRGRKAFLATINDVTEKVRLQKQLVQEQINHQKSITQAAIEAQERERSDLGKELHDNVNQMLTAVKLYVENIKYYPEQSEAFVQKSIVLVERSINEIRRLSRALVTPTIRDVGFEATLQELVDSYREMHLFDIQLTLDFNEGDLDNGVKLTVYRILQEAFNNTIKYAKASLVEIKILATRNNLKLDYLDDGVGFDLATVRKGLGLSNIKNRTDAYKGKMRIKSAPGHGCHIKIIFPLYKHDY